MTQPSIANLWPAQLQPWWTPDLAVYVAAVAGMWAETDQYLEDPDNDIVAYQALLDVDLAPFKALPWLAQCVGERVPVGYTDPKPATGSATRRNGSAAPPKASGTP